MSNTMKTSLHQFIILAALSCTLAAPAEKSCERYDFDDLIEIQCANAHNHDLPLDSILVIQFIRAKNLLTVQCPSTGIDFLKLLPRADLPHVDHLHIKYCGLPKSGYKAVLNILGIQKIATLKILEFNRSPIELSSVLFKDMEYLEYLELADHQEITFADNILTETPQLKVLALSAKHIANLENLNFTAVPNLEVLQILSNNLEKIHNNWFNDLKHLKKLYLFSNKLVELDQITFEGMKDLEVLELSKNKIRRLQNKTLEGLVNLSRINLFGNQLKDFGQDVLKNNKNLYEIRLNFNPDLKLLDRALAHLPNLQRIRLDHCKFTNLPEDLFTGSSNIRSIHLNDNNLESLPNGLFDGLLELLVLDLSRNKLQDLSNVAFSAMGSLKELRLQYNRLSVLPSSMFFNLNQLEVLDLHDNRLGQLTLGKLPKVKYMDVSYNRLEVVNMPQQLTQIKYFNASHNRLADFRKTYMPLLAMLDLSHNQLTKIDIKDVVPKSLTNNVALDFSNNLIETVDISNMPTNDFSILVNLLNNRISCNCLNIPLISYLQDSSKNKVLEFVNPYSLKCSQPLPFKHKELTKVDQSLIDCTITKNEYY